MLTCKECGGRVYTVDGKLVRGCSHKDAPVVAAMSATCTGKGGACK